MATKVGSVVFIGGGLVLAAVLFLHPSNNGKSDTDKKDDESVVTIAWNVAGHNYSKPQSQPILWWEFAGGNSGNTFIMTSGPGKRSWNVKKGRHILTWISVDVPSTPTTAIQDITIAVNGKQVCGAPVDHRGHGQGGVSAVCEATS